jgi:ATP-dependent DNA ligase
MTRSAPRPSGFIEPCQPSKAVAPPSGPLWVHEIKYDGYRLMVRWEGEYIRCFTRNGHDWPDRFPAIVDAAQRFAEHLNVDGPTIFDHVCRMGLEGIVSKRIDAPYRSGPSKTWLKSKNRASEAVRRKREEEWR